MSFAAQVRAAAGADIIAGVDGSALHLSVFMQPGSHMLVLETTRRRNVIFLNALMEIETVWVPTILPHAGARKRRLDPKQLDAALDRLGCPPAPGLLQRLLDRLFR
jgi:hypothetical protein